MTPTLDDLRGQMRTAQIDPATPLGVTLLTAVEIAQHAASAVLGARGLTPEGEAALIQRVTERAALGQRQLARDAVRSMRLGAVVVLGVALAVLATIAAGAGFLAGEQVGRASVLTTEADLRAAFAQGPEAAAIALRLLRTTNLVKAWGICERTASPDPGRPCALPVWTVAR